MKIFILTAFLWSEDIVLDPYPLANQYLPHFFQKAIAENRFHLIVAGYENPNWTKSINFIYFKPFNGNWSSKKKPCEGTDFDEHPSILCDENNYLYIFYQKITRYTDYAIYHQHSRFPASYENFTPPEEINFGSERTSEIYVNALIDENKKIQIVFSSDSENYFNIYHGIEINPYYFEIHKITSQGENIFPQILNLNDTTYIFYLKIFPDGSSKIALNKYRGNYKGEIILEKAGENIKNFFALHYFNTYIFLFYTKNRKINAGLFDLHSSKIIDTAEIFSGIDVEEPNAVCDSFGGIHLFFTCGEGNERDIFYTHSQGNLDFSNPEQLTFTPFPSYSPHGFYSKNEGNLYVFWIDERDKELGEEFYSKIFYKFKYIGKREAKILLKNLVRKEEIRKSAGNLQGFDITGRKLRLKNFKNGVIFLMDENRKIKILGL